MGHANRGVLELPGETPAPDAVKARRPRGGPKPAVWVRASTKFIVDAHQGTISVESKPGQGSTFAVTIPALPL